MIPLALGSGRMVVGSEITTSTTEHMAGIDPAPFLRYRGRLVPINALVIINGPTSGLSAIRKLSPESSRDESRNATILRQLAEWGF
jgi:hypothetical protein